MSQQSPIDRHTPMQTGGQFSPTSARIGPASAVLIGISVVVALLTSVGDKASAVSNFLISNYTADLPEVTHGEVWRLITPIFLHFGILHILFNMLWLKDLGTMVEKRSSTALLMMQVAFIGVISNLVQYHFAGPNFGGMSGVVYGLLGYVWMRAHFNPGSGYYLEKQNLVMMILWLFACMFGLIPNVANWAHGAGIVVGIAWGFWDAQTYRRRASTTWSE